MSNNLTNAYALHAEITDLQKTMQDEKHALSANKYAQIFFTIGTWIIYLLFGAAMYAAPLWVLQTFFTANAGNYLAIAVIGVFLLVFPTALALGKHAGYRALSKRGIDPRWIGAIIAFFIVSGIYFESTSASSQQQEKAFQQVETSKAGEAIMNTTVATNGGAYASLIADAEFKLVACQRKMAEGKYKDCNNSQARVDSLKAQAEADRQSAITANTQAIKTKQEALDKERDSHSLPIAKMFSEFMNSTVSTGAVIAALIAALIFEISHAMTIYNEWRLKAEIAGLDGQFKKMKINYFHNTGKQFNTGDFRDTQVIDLDKMRESGDLKGAIPAAAFSPAPIEPTALQKAGQAIAGEFMQAQAARNALHQTIMDKATMRESGGFKQSPEQREMVDKLAADTTGKTYRDSIRNGFTGFQNTALDAPVTSPSSVSGTAPDVQRETVHVQPDSPSADVQSDTVHVQSKQQDQAELSDTARQAEIDLYPSWRGKVAAREITPSARDAKRFISQSVFTKGDKTILTIQEMQRIWESWQERAANDGLLTANPRFKQGNRQPKYVLS